MGIYKFKDPIARKLSKGNLFEEQLLELLPNLNSENLPYFVKQRFITPEILIEAFKYLDESELFWIFDHEKCPSHLISPWVLSALKKYQDVNYGYDRGELETLEKNLYYALSNPNCPSKILEKVFGIDDDFDEVVLRHPNITSKIVDKVFKLDDLEQLETIARNRNLPEISIDKIIKLNYTKLNKVLIKNPKLNSKQLKLIQSGLTPKSKKSADKVKLATDMWTTPKELHALSRDIDKNVRVAVSTNTKLPESSIESLIKNEESVEVLLSLNKHQYLDQAKRAKLMKRLDDMSWRLNESESHLYEEVNSVVDDYYERY